MNAEQSAFPSWPYSAQISHGSLEAIRREERLSAALYQREQQLQQREQQLQHYHILYGYPHSNK
jgi:predicted FMN-binding regulatory protein PaiB